jgi:xylulokinase
MSPGVAPWENDLLSVSGLDVRKFPQMVEMGTPVGQVTAAASSLTGLPRGLAVIGGTTDYFGGILGSGAVCAGTACDNGGTSQSFNLCWDAPLTAKGIFCVPSFAQGFWYLGGPASTTGRALEWWRENILGVDADDWTLIERAADIAPGSEGLVFLPYLAGERAPLWDPSARGVFFGLDLDHKRDHMTRSILEGVAFAVRHIMDQIESTGACVKQINCCSGQASSELWCQIKADVLDRRVIVPEVLDAAPLGSAIIAGVGVGVFESFAAGANKMVRPHRTFEPDAERHSVYDAVYKRYRALYPAVKEIYST